MNDYFSAPGISFHKLRDFGAVSPMYYYRRHVAGTLESTSTTRMREGRLIHLAVLEPDKFATIPACPQEHLTEGGKLSTRNATRAWLASLQGKDFATDLERRMCLSIARAVRSNADALAVLAGAAYEVERFSERDGYVIKGKMDILKPGEVWDLKSVDTLDGIIRSCREYHYPQQLAWYQDLAGVTGGGLIVGEKNEPFRVEVIRFADDVMAAARAGVNTWWRALMDCIEADHWPNDRHGARVVTMEDLANA